VTVKTAFRPALTVLALFSVLLGLAYPALVTGVAQAVFPAQANGTILREQGGKARVGSALIGQPFSGPAYFWGRPSATSPQPYDGKASGGSNLGPSNPALWDAVRERVTALRATGPGSRGRTPVDLVTASASGLDPDISPAGALYQVSRVARTRGLEEAQVQRLVQESMEGRFLGLLGEPRVNVLRLNLALDRLAQDGPK